MAWTDRCGVIHYGWGIRFIRAPSGTFQMIIGMVRRETKLSDKKDIRKNVVLSMEVRSRDKLVSLAEDVTLLIHHH